MGIEPIAFGLKDRYHHQLDYTHNFSIHCEYVLSI